MSWRRLVYAVLAANVFALTVPLAIFRLRLVGDGAAQFHHHWVATGVIFTAAGCCLFGALRHRAERPAWLLLGAGLAAYASGQLYYTVDLVGRTDPPYPSLADPLWLALYPATVGCLFLLLRARQREYQALLCVDGLVVGFGVAAITAALIYPAIIASVAQADPAVIATTLAYPSSDLLVVVLISTVFGLAGWRPGRAWLLLGAGLLVTTATDISYAWAVAHGSAALPDELFSGWGVGVTLLALAAWQLPQPQTEVRLAGRPALLMPTAFACIALALLIYGNVAHVNLIAVVLATATLAAAIVRGALTFRALASSHELAHSDPLTGLPNRRALSAALEAAAHGTVVAIYDLDGFKQYNDRFGHHEGDLLLIRLAQRLRSAVDPGGRAFRLAGDEFCVLATAQEVIDKAADALIENGPGFAITASYGTACFPVDGATGSDVLRIADARMYRRKFRSGNFGSDQAA
jgi:diguanylate cyclase (GGDEF)-like protein